MKAASEVDPLVSSNGNGSGSHPASNNSSFRNVIASVVIALGMMVVVGSAGYALGRSYSTPGPTSFTTTQTSIRFDAHSPHSYEATQFISFTINTLGGKAEFGECQDLPVDPDSNTCYLGNSQNLTEDVYHRLGIIEGILTKLEESMLEEDSEVDLSPNVLKIFSMPEFFLRGPHGAYSTLELIDREGTENDGLLIQVGRKKVLTF